MLQEEVTSSERQSGTTTILIVEDDDSIGEVLAVALSEEPSYTLVLARTAEEVFPILMSASLERHLPELAQRHLMGLSKLFDLEDVLAVVREAIG